MLKTKNLQDIIYKSMGDDINVTINSLFLFVPNLIPSVETQLIFNEATHNNYRISYHEYYTERRLTSDMIVQVDIGSTQQVNSPKNLICAHQTETRIGSPTKNKNNAIFDHPNFRKFHVEIDGQRYPRDNLLITYEQIDYIEQYKNLILYFIDYVGEPILGPFISYSDKETTHPIEVEDLRHQFDHLTPKKFQLFHEYSADPDNARLFLILIRRKEIKMILNGIKLNEVKVVLFKILNFRDFMKKIKLKLTL